MPKLSIGQVASVINGKLYAGKVDPDVQISSLSIDSRTIFDP